MNPTYCRRESCKTKGGARITKTNALNWCEECRASLPFFPADADESRASMTRRPQLVAIGDAVLPEVA